jgi:hypothetical protein
MNLTKLKSLFADNGCTKIYIKRLAPNHNSKNQVYFGGNFEILNILPISEIKNEAAGDWNKERFKAIIKFSWIDEEGLLFPAPHSQLILYPKYPEVRFSGFLKGCEKAPSNLMAQRLADRLLFFGVAKNETVLGFVTAPNSSLSDEFLHEASALEHGVFKVLELPLLADNRAKLLEKLLYIHQLGWIRSKSLGKNGIIVPCESSQCGGYTLEAELGIIRNSLAEPDYLGWEVKNFGVKNFDKLQASTITLFTPEPTDGIYKTEGAEAFLRKYGYPDKSGKEDRINFGGVHKIGARNKLTKLEMNLVGFDAETGKIRNTDGRIALMDMAGNETASWSFSSLLLHWNRKHNQACYVPSLSETATERQYRYGNKIILGTGTDFQLFLTEMAQGNVYYDPGVKMENASTNPKIKRRSQFRIRSKNLPNLYKINEVIDIETNTSI